MLSNNDKDKLDRANGFAEERYIDKVRLGVKKQYSLEDEIAILRKLCKCLLEAVIELHGEEIVAYAIEEFTRYDRDIESIKADAASVKTEGERT